MYFRTFLLNDRLNTNGWRIPRDVIVETATKWLGVKGILHRKCSTCDYEHSESSTLEEALRLSDQDAVTVIKNVIWDDNTSTLYAEHEIIAPGFEKVLCNEDVYAVSASIWKKNPDDPDDPISSDYTPVHLAFLDIPGAYGKSAEHLETNCVCKRVKSECDTNQGMDKEEHEEENQKMSMEQEVHEMYAMLKAMTKEEEPKKTSMPKDDDDDKEKTSQKTSSAAKKSFDWVQASSAVEPEKITIENTPNL